MNIKYYHLYNRLVRRKLEEPLVHAHCGDPFTLGATNDGEVMLQCFTCHTTVTPGAKLNGIVAGAVKKHFNI